MRIEALIFRFANRLADTAVFAAAFILGTWTRYYLDYFGPLFARLTPDTIALLFMVFIGLNHFALSFTRVYPTSRLRSFNESALIYFKSVYLCMIWIIVLAFAVQSFRLSRMLLFSATTYAFLLLLAKEKLFRHLIRKFRSKGGNQKHVVIVGDDPEWLSRTARQIQSDPIMGLKVIGVITTKPSAEPQIGGIRVLGEAGRFMEIIESEVVDCVVMPSPSVDPAKSQEIGQYIWLCEERGIEVWLALGFGETNVRQLEVEHIEGGSFLSLRTGPRNTAALIVKYAMDRVLALILLVLLLPLMLLIGLIVRIGSPGPALFKQHRAGINGRRFIFFKFRSMINNAEAHRASLQHLNEMTGPVFKVTNDPRITPFGRFIRRTSLDELPQLWNVLRGEMSLVGPRPLIMPEAAKVTGWARRRFSMKPGITGLWQVSGRNDVVDFSKWAGLDLKYIDEWSLWLDFKILWMTVGAVLRCTGR